MNCSVVMTAHDEGLLLQPTLLALCASAQYLAARGGQCELVVVADSADDLTVAVAERFASAAPFPTRVLRTDHFEPGPARNDGVAASRYDSIAIHDGDELVCETWLFAALSFLSAHPRTIAHSQWSCVFGEENFWWGHPIDNDLMLDADDFELSNPWSVQCVAAKEIFVDIPYRAYRSDPVFEFEDWFWNAETARAGYRHLAVPDTVHAVRRKFSSRDKLAITRRKVVQSARPALAPGA